jgi:hypothetical protein
MSALLLALTASAHAEAPVIYIPYEAAKPLCDEHGPSGRWKRTGGCSAANLLWSSPLGQLRVHSPSMSHPLDRSKIIEFGASSKF